MTASATKQSPRDETCNRGQASVSFNKPETFAPDDQEKRSADMAALPLRRACSTLDLAPIDTGGGGGEVATQAALTQPHAAGSGMQ